MSKVTRICKELPAGTWIRCAVESLEGSISGLMDMTEERPDEMDYFMLEVTKATTELMALQEKMAQRRNMMKLVDRYGRV
jgi:hypothetical protein